MLILSLTGCNFLHIRRPIIEQGNDITKAEVSKLHTGMSPSEVSAIMGTPVLIHTFTPNRIEYAYTYHDGYTRTKEKHVTCIFVDNRLTRIDTSGV
jgi:outer membrane protein assembly factor BamE